MDDSTKALVVLGVVVALFIWNRLPIGVVAILAALGLWATDLSRPRRRLPASATRW